jgi:hypothetical protein
VVTSVAPNIPTVSSPLSASPATTSAFPCPNTGVTGTSSAAASGC